MPHGAGLGPEVRAQLAAEPRRHLEESLAGRQRLLELGDRAPEDAQLAGIPLPIPLSSGCAAGGGAVGAGRHMRGWLYRRGKLPDKGSRRLLEG